MSISKVRFNRCSGLKDNFKKLHGRPISEMASDMSKFVLPDGSIEVGGREDGNTKQAVGEQGAGVGSASDGAGQTQPASADIVPQF